MLRVSLLVPLNPEVISVPPHDSVYQCHEAPVGKVPLTVIELTLQFTPDGKTIAGSMPLTTSCCITIALVHVPVEPYWYPPPTLV